MPDMTVVIKLTRINKIRGACDIMSSVAMIFFT